MNNVVEMKRCLVDFTLTNGRLIQMSMSNARKNNHINSPVALYSMAVIEQMEPSLLNTLMKSGWKQIDHEDLRKLNEQLAEFFLTGITNVILYSFIKNLMNATYEILDGYKRGASMMICSNPEELN